MRAGGDRVGGVGAGGGANPVVAVTEGELQGPQRTSIPIHLLQVSEPQPPTLREKAAHWPLVGWLFRQSGPAPVAQSHEDPLSDPISAESGAHIYIENISDTSFRFSSKSVHDAAQMAMLFLEDDITDQRDKTYPSLAWVVRFLRHASDEGRMYRIGTANRSYLFGYDPATSRWFVTIRGSEFPTPRRIERFKMMKERVLMESVAEGTRSDAARKLLELIKPEYDPDANYRSCITLPEFADRADWYAKAGSLGCLLSVGIKLDRNGKIIELIVEFYEGGHRDTDIDNPRPCLHGREGAAPVEVRPTHIVTFRGRATQKLSTRWRASSTDPTRSDEKMLFGEYEGFLRGIVRPGSDPQLEDEALLPEGTAASSRRRGVVRHFRDERSPALRGVRRGGRPRVASLSHTRAVRNTMR